MTPTPLVLGAMMFGTHIEESTSFALLDRFVEAGGEWIDTADCYSFWASDTGHGGQSETLLGRWLATRPGVRDRVKIATKLGAEPTVVGGWPEQRQGLSAAAVRTALAGQPRPTRRGFGRPALASSGGPVGTDRGDRGRHRGFRRDGDG